MTNVANRSTIHRRGCLIAAVLALAAWSSTAQAQPQGGSPGPSEVDFVRDIQPIFAKRCYECHGEELQEADLRLDNRESTLHEDFVTPGNADDSLLYELLISQDDDRMPPPDEGEPLPANEIALIKAWIDQGAQWPTESNPPQQPDEPMPLTPQQDPVTEPNPQTERPPTQTETETDQPPAPGDEGETAAQEPAQPGDNQPDQAAGEEAKPEPTTPLTPTQEFWLKVWEAFGDLHPAVAHFPVALLIIGGLAALFSFRGSYACADFAYYCLWLGAITSLFASGLGWSFAWNEGHREDPFLFDMTAKLFWHRWTGAALTVLSLLLAMFAAISRRRDPENGALWRLGLLVLAGLTVYVGHAGGELTHRRGYGKIIELFSTANTDAPAAANNNADNDNADEAP
jgi:uncharacterized membrane protein